jgi:hypothetical protein
MKRLALGLLLILPAFGQQQPNISRTFTFTGATPGAAVSAEAQPAVAWRLTYYASSATAFSALSIELDGAPDVNGTAPGPSDSSWTLISTIVTQGTNPLTNTSNGTLSLQAYYPWVRVNITTLTGTGTVKAQLLGYVGTSASTGSGGGGGSLNGDVIGPQTANVIEWHQVTALPTAAAAVLGRPYLWTQATTANTCPAGGSGGTGGSGLAACITFDNTAWQPIGPGNVIGPASVTGGNLARFNGSTGKIISDGGPLIHPIGWAFDGAGLALAPGETGYYTVPFGCSITAWNITVDAGTATVSVWKVATGTAIPTVADTINTSGLSISAGTAVHSTTLTDFTTTTITANDILAFNLDAVATATKLSFVLQCQ